MLQTAGITIVVSQKARSSLPVKRYFLEFFLFLRAACRVGDKYRIKYRLYIAIYTPPVRPQEAALRQIVAGDKVIQPQALPSPRGDGSTPASHVM